MSGVYVCVPYVATNKFAIVVIHYGKKKKKKKKKSHWTSCTINMAAGFFCCLQENIQSLQYMMFQEWISMVICCIDG